MIHIKQFVAKWWSTEWYCIMQGWTSLFTRRVIGRKPKTLAIRKIS